MIELRLPPSTATIHVADDVVEKYERQGWVRVEPKPTRRRKSE